MRAPKQKPTRERKKKRTHQVNNGTNTQHEQKIKKNHNKKKEAE